VTIEDNTQDDILLILQWIFLILSYRFRDSSCRKG